jgi:hypothetical protein
MPFGIVVRQSSCRFSPAEINSYFMKFDGFLFKLNDSGVFFGSHVSHFRGRFRRRNRGYNQFDHPQSGFAKRKRYVPFCWDFFHKISAVDLSVLVVSSLCKNEIQFSEYFCVAQSFATNLRWPRKNLIISPTSEESRKRLRTFAFRESTRKLKIGIA